MKYEDKLFLTGLALFIVGAINRDGNVVWWGFLIWYTIMIAFPLLLIATALIMTAFKKKSKKKSQ